MVAVFVVLCLASFSSSALSVNCATKGDTKCATTWGGVSAVAGSMAAVFIGIYMFNGRRGGGVPAGA